MNGSPLVAQESSWPVQCNYHLLFIAPFRKGPIFSPGEIIRMTPFQMTANSDQDFLEEDVWEAATQRANGATIWLSMIMEI